MKRIYCITGLGADERVFQHLTIKNAELIHISWPPLTANDDMQSYAKKIVKQIKDESPVIIGLSFGGMLAVEIAKIIPTAKVFLVSSARTRNELGFNAPIWKFIVNKNLVLFSLFKVFAPLSRYRLGINTAEEKLLVNDLIRNIDTTFLKQAIRIIVNWNNFDRSDKIIQIHGTRDKIISPADVKPDHWVDGGGHFMIYNKAEIISRLIEQHL